MRKTKKILTICICVAVVFSMCLGTAATAFGKKSITRHDKKPRVVVDDRTGGTGTGGTGGIPGNPAVITEPDKSRYENEDLKNVIDEAKLNDITPSDIFDLIPQKNPDKQNPREFPVEGSENLKVNLKLYERITELLDIGVLKDGKFSFKMDKDSVTVTIQADAVIGLKDSDFLMMLMDPKTGEIYLLTPQDFDPKTGTFKVKLPIFGTFTLIKKLPIVVRDIHPEEYLDQDVTEAVKKLPERDYVELTDCLKAFGQETNSLEVGEADTQNKQSVASKLDPIDEVYASSKIKPANFLSANYLADIAVRVNKGTYRYNLSENLWADLYQDIDECDWKRVLDYAGVKYDEKAIKKDRLELTKIKPFVLKGGFVYHVDADTGEINIANEPVISFGIMEDETDITDPGNGKKFDQDEVHVENNDKSKESDDVVVDKTGNTSLVDNNREVTNRDNKSVNKSVSENKSIIDSLVLGEKDEKSLLEGLNIVETAYAIDESQLTQKEKDILTWDVEDIDEKNDDNLCMLMSSNQYKGMGPFLLYMPKEGKSAGGFSWWWLLLIIPVLIIIYIIYRKNKNRKSA